MKKTTTEILAFILKNPRISDRKAADIIGVSQPTVTRQRCKLQESGILTFSAYPNLAKLGYSIMAFTELSDFTTLKSLEQNDSVVFLAKMPSRIFVISVHKDIGEYELFEGIYPSVINAMHITLRLAETVKTIEFNTLVKPDK